MGWVEIETIRSDVLNNLPVCGVVVGCVLVWWDCGVDGVTAATIFKDLPIPIVGRCTAGSATATSSISGRSVGFVAALIDF